MRPVLRFPHAKKMTLLRRLSGAALLCLVLMDVITTTSCITTTHYNKPLDAIKPVMASEVKKQEDQYFNITLPPSERHKRLLPYMNFYLTQPFNQPHRQQTQQTNGHLHRLRILVGKQNPLQPYNKFNEFAGVNIQPPPVGQQGKVKYTPFTQTNALPGPFVPMKSDQFQPNNQPNFSEIYEKLLQLKYFEQNRQSPQQIRYHPQYEQYEKQPIINYVAIKDYQEIPSRKILQPPKTTVHTYTPTQVDITPPPLEYQQTYQQNYQGGVENHQAVYQDQRPIQIVEFVNPPFQKPQEYPQDLMIFRQKQPSLQENFAEIQQETNEEKQKIFQEQLRIYEDQQQVYKNEQKLLEEEEQRRIAEEERRIYADQLQKQLVYAPSLPQQNLQDHRYAPIDKYRQPSPKYHHQIMPIQNLQPLPAPYSSETSEFTTKSPEQYPITEDPNNLGEILRKLQASNTLPQSLTPENIDNSIKTLVKILNMLRKHQRLSKKPIVVIDQDQSIANNEAGVEYKGPQAEDLSGTVMQTFPDDTVEGGTPGKAGIDYPALSSIPQTSFSCKTQRYKGFFGDPDTNCQVWHYCDFNGGQASFLCPNGTIFSQVALTCDWWYNVKCSSTSQLYVLNERLYKYILPFSPKFPEDYSGPLVDRYLALKFQEMEEKMKKQRKKPKESNDENQSEEIDEESDKEKEIDDADQLQIQNEESRRNASISAEKIVEINTIRRSVS